MIYTPMEKALIEALKIKQQEQTALEMDLLLLEMERQQNMMDGYKMEEWVL